MIDLSAAGLSKTEAKSYQVLLSNKQWQPSALAKIVSESRTNMYKILDKLVALGLAEKFDLDKKIHYKATNPSRLIQLAHDARAAREQSEKQLELQAQSLMSEYIKTHEQPGIRFYQGKDDITNIFTEISHSKEPVYFMHTIAGIDFYDYAHMHSLRMLAVDKEVERFGLTPDTHLAHKNYKETDAAFKLTRTWLKDTDYTAPVEWGVFEDKMYIISYGEEALGMVIESSQIANAFKQVYALLDRGQRSQPWYESLPVLAGKHAKA